MLQHVDQRECENAEHVDGQGDEEEEEETIITTTNAIVDPFKKRTDLVHLEISHSPLYK